MDRGVTDFSGPGVLIVEDEQSIRDVLVELFDVPLDDTRRKPLVEALNRGGGVAALAKPESVAGLVYNALPVLMAAPETHLC